MTELKPRIHDECNGLDYVLVGDYYVPDLKLPEEHRPIGMWGRLHRTYLEQYRPTRFSALCLSGELHTYLADLDEQATERCSLIIEQMKQAEGVTETMKADNQMLWVQSMNSIRNRAEEIIRQEMLNGQPFADRSSHVTQKAHRLNPVGFCFAGAYCILAVLPCVLQASRGGCNTFLF